MVIMSVIYCRLLRGHVHLLKRKRSRHARILCTMKLQVCGHGTKKRGRIYVNWAYVGDLLNPVQDTTTCHQFALDISLLCLNSCWTFDIAIVILQISF
jgi:hypothetical protein